MPFVLTIKRCVPIRTGQIARLFAIRVEIRSRLKARGQMRTYLSLIASLLLVVLGCIQALLGEAVPNFTVAANPVTVQLHVGGTATSEISSSSDNGFYGSVQLACQDLPPAMFCSFTPPALQMEGAVVVSSQLTISATKSNAAMLDSGQ